MLRERLITALIMAAVMIAAVLWAPSWLTATLFGLIMLAGAWEWSAFLRVPLAGRFAYVALVTLIAGAALVGLREPQHYLWIIGGASAAWCVALWWILLAPAWAPRYAAALAGILALVPTWLILLHIDANWTRGPQWTLFLLILAFSADTGAFFAGRRFGRHKLAPRVSPGKTWEGVVGGLAFAAVAALAGAWWFGLSPVPFLAICVLAAAFSIVGDLLESLFKRASGLKDSGRLFPGHGGILDRIDSVTAAVPVLAVGLRWLGVGT